MITGCIPSDSSLDSDMLTQANSKARLLSLPQSALMQVARVAHWGVIITHKEAFAQEFDSTKYNISLETFIGLTRSKGAYAGP